MPADSSPICTPGRASCSAWLNAQRRCIGRDNKAYKVDRTEGTSGPGSAISEGPRLASVL